MYHPGLCEWATRYCLLGLDDARIAKHFGVTVTTLQHWMTHKPEFSEAIKNGRERADGLVANAMFLKATGQWTQPAVKIVAKIEILPDGTERKSEHVVHYTEHFPPSESAAIFWLKNRQQEFWRDKREYVLPHDQRSLLEDYSEEELIARLLAKRAPQLAPPMKQIAQGNGQAKKGNGHGDD